MPSDLHRHALHLLRLVSRMERLEALPRTGWLVSGVSSPESVASHIYLVTLIALWIADQLRDLDPHTPLDTERVMRVALLHDAGESLLTDLPWPVKRFVDPDAIHQAESRAAALLFENSPPRWLDDFHLYHQADSLEARIVKAADRIQMLAKALQYEAQGRGDLRRFWETPRNFDDFGIPLVRAILDTLIQLRQDQSWWPSNFD